MATDEKPDPLRDPHPMEMAVAFEACLRNAPERTMLDGTTGIDIDIDSVRIAIEHFLAGRRKEQRG
jgi:hypothetical protein